MDGSVDDIFDKDKVEKRYYHYRYVCCIRSRIKTVRAVLKRLDGKIVKVLERKKQADNVLKFLNGTNANVVMESRYN
jgi:hypothetical protein